MIQETQQPHKKTLREYAELRCPCCDHPYDNFDERMQTPCCGLYIGYICNSNALIQYGNCWGCHQKQESPTAAPQGESPVNTQGYIPHFVEKAKPTPPHPLKSEHCTLAPPKHKTKMSFREYAPHLFTTPSPSPQQHTDPSSPTDQDEDSFTTISNLTRSTPQLSPAPSSLAEPYSPTRTWLSSPAPEPSDMTVDDLNDAKDHFLAVWEEVKGKLGGEEKGRIIGDILSAIGGTIRVTF